MRTLWACAAAIVLAATIPNTASGGSEESSPTGDSAAASDVTAQTTPQPSLTVSDVTDTSAKLTIRGWGTTTSTTGPWYYKATGGPHTSCSGAQRSTSVTLTGLKPKTPYTYSAYSDETCSSFFARAETFTTTDETGSSLDDYFEDDDGSVFEESINKIAKEGITKGCDKAGNLFCPNQAVTRAQMAVFLARALKLPAAAGDGGFKDTQGFAQGSIAAIAAAGITKGCNDAGDLFCPNRPITREQMAAFLARALKLSAPANPITFDDTADSDFKDYIAAIAAAGITKGCNDAGNLFCPKQSVTRGQMAAFLVRALKL